MEKENSPLNIFDIQVAKREYQKNNKAKIIRPLIFITPLFFLFSFLLWSQYQKALSLISTNVISDGKILGHLPYLEVSKNKLVEIQPDILVHKDMFNSLLEMKIDAEKDGIYLVFLSGFRSIELQKEIFYSLKSIRNQNASERAKVSAPPGYSEHSTGFAIDIGDAHNRLTDFEVEFEETKAFKWLKRNAAKYHFVLSFNKDHKSVDYEPWHWRYEGSIDALKIFEQANRGIKIY